MDWYSIVKFLHIASATLWVGGGFALMLLAVRADRAGNIEGVCSDAGHRRSWATGSLRRCRCSHCSSG